MVSHNDPSATFMEHSPINDEDDDEPNTQPVMIVGAGIVGLTLALALQKHAGLTVPLYDQAPSFSPGIGAGMGMYPNGLRVLRDISPHLLRRVQEEGYPFVWRRWEHHDGTEVVTAREKALSPSATKGHTDDYDDLQPLGIRRWKLQQILYEAVQKADIPVHFQKKIASMASIPSKSHQKEFVRLTFTDGTTVSTRLLLAADGAKSMIRQTIAGHLTQLTYTGTTCWYGVSSVPRFERGICFPMSETTQCHGCFYPTGPNEQCFQLHMPAPSLSSSNVEEQRGTSPPMTSTPNEYGGWTSTFKSLDQSECLAMAHCLEQDGWNEKYSKPIRQMDQAIRVPFTVLNPPLEKFHFGRVVLLGDAAHPPVPYLGQGAQQGLEDAGTLAMIMRHVCTAEDPRDSSCNKEKRRIQWDHVDEALKLYSQIRVPRTNEIIHEHSQNMGASQQRRSHDRRYNQVEEERIRRDVFFHESHSAIFPGTNYNYKAAVELNIQQMPLLSVPEDGGC